MVFIKVCCSENVAHACSDSDNETFFFCIDSSFKFRFCLLGKIHDFLHKCATYSVLPSNIGTMSIAVFYCANCGNHGLQRSSVLALAALMQNQSRMLRNFSFLFVSGGGGFIGL